MERDVVQSVECLLEVLASQDRTTSVDTFSEEAPAPSAQTSLTIGVLKAMVCVVLSRGKHIKLLLLLEEYGEFPLRLRF